MKHISLSFIAVGLLLLCGCSEDNLKIIPDIDPNAIPLHFYASMESQQDSTMVTRATLSGTSTDDTRKVLWEPSDSIYVTNGKFGAKFSNVTEENADVAEFSGKLGLGTEYYAAFPYSFINGFESTEFQLTLPAIQDYKADGFASESFPMVARCVDNVFEFKNLCGILVLNLTGTQTIDSIRFSGKSDTINMIKVSGPASVEMTYTDIPSLVIDSTANDYVILNCINSEGKGVALNTSKPTPFHIVLPAETYAYFTVVIYSSDGKHMTINSEKPLTIKRSKRTTASSITFLADKPVYEFVDLGLSVKWATINVGANKPEEVGNYYAWGEIETKDVYDWTTYKWCKGSEEAQIKYCINSNQGYKGFVDSKSVLDPEDDVANIEWGDGWRMPSMEEIIELYDNCNWIYTSQNGVNGYLIKSKLSGYSSNSIFLPVTGRKKNSELLSYGIGFIWSSSLDVEYNQSTHALQAYYSESDQYPQYDYRYQGCPVRPVRISEEWLDNISVSLDKDTIEAVVGYLSAINLTASIKKGDSEIIYPLKWSSNNLNVATVSEDGSVSIQSVGTAIITADIKGIKDSCVVIVKEPDYVDLGLSVLWATCNVGANSPGEYGNYYAWGEINTKKDFSGNNYKWYNISDGKITITKYTTLQNNGFTDEKNYLDLEDDIANVLYGKGWRMPTKEEFEELKNNCIWTLSNKGYTVTSKVDGFGDKSIFLPFAGSYDGINYITHSGCYWSNSLCENNSDRATLLVINSNYYSILDDLRRCGQTVRAVYPSASYIDKISVSFENESENVQIDGSKTLKTIIKEGNRVVSHSIDWSSSDPSIVTVDQDGIITGIKIGTATITANCKGKTATCTVSVVMPDYVDLGLSVLWATCNVGASTFTDHGSYYAWGEIETKSNFGWSNYSLSQGTETSMTKYCLDASAGYYGFTDSKKNLDLEDDIAHVKWGDNWCMPTKVEFDELLNNCKWQWTIIDGVWGYKISGQIAGYVNNFIFLPTTPTSGESSTTGLYWSKTLSNDNSNLSYRLQFSGTSYFNMHDYMRCLGHAVRPVTPSTSWLSSLTISLDEESVSLQRDETTTITATVKKGNDDIVYPVSWSSDNPNVATVNESGVITAITAGSANITATIQSKSVTCSVTVTEKPYEYVDLGLSVYWATFNVGATKPVEYGTYYAWGEINSNIRFDKYRFISRSDGVNDKLIKYCTDIQYGRNGSADYKTNLELVDDIAHIKWGDNWRIPSKDEFEELLLNCTWQWKNEEGVNGYRIASNIPGYTNNSIFIPAGGYKNDSFLSDNGVACFYWSNYLNVEQPFSAWFLRANSNDKNMYTRDRPNEMSIRPVITSDTWPGITSLQLNQDNISIAEGQFIKLKATLMSGENTVYYPISWSSSNHSVASVDDLGNVTALSEGDATITATCLGQTSSCNVVVIDVNNEFVDLGLSVNWATINIGAKKNSDFGGFYAWGETDTKTDYKWDTYKYSHIVNVNGNPYSLTKYCNNYGYNNYVDNLRTLELSDDVASEKWGGNWRIPTKDEFKELIQNCIWTWTTIDGVDGYLIAGKRAGFNNNSIFLPASGRKTFDINVSGNVGTRGFYWTSDLSTESYKAWYLYFHDEAAMMRDDNNDRAYGLRVRAVFPSTTWPGISSIELNHDELSLAVGSKESLSTIIKIGNETVKYPVTWSSNNSSIAKVDDNGLITGLEAGSAIITATCYDKTTTCTVTVGYKENGYDYVDLGLSVKWATCNVGASSPEEYGDYFSWGITETYYQEGYAQSENPIWKSGIVNGYDWSDYKYCKGSNIMNGNLKKYNNDGLYGEVDNIMTLESVDDVATAEMGGSWRIPSKYEMEELMDGEKCTWEWTSINGKYGYKIISKVLGFEGNNIFLPLAGYREGTLLRSINISGGYWCNSVVESSSYSGNNLYLEPNNYIALSNTSRALGRSVRPVCP